jgi:hypothetical protein
VTAPRGWRTGGRPAGMDPNNVYDTEDHRDDGEQWEDEERDR